MSLPLAIFVGLFLLEPAYFVSQHALSKMPGVPIGALMGLATLSIVCRYLRTPAYTVLLFGMVIAGVAVWVTANLSPHYDNAWVLLFAWYMAKLTLGFSVARDLSKRDWECDLVVYGVAAASLAVWALLTFVGAETFNYLRPSSTLLYAGVIAIFCAKSNWLRVVIYVSVASALVALTSRTYVYLWLMVPVLIWAATFLLKGNLTRRLVASSVAVAAVVICAGVALLALYSLPDEWLPNRLVPTFSMTEQGLTVSDNSINVRVRSITNGLEQIRMNPIAGFYNGFMEYGGPGYYMHNVLSYWHQFGAIPFALLVVALMWVGSRLFAGVGPGARIGAVIFALTIVGVAASRSYTDTNLFFALGFGAAIVSRRSAMAHTG